MNDLGNGCEINRKSKWGDQAIEKWAWVSVEYSQNEDSVTNKITCQITGKIKKRLWVTKRFSFSTNIKTGQKFISIKNSLQCLIFN